MHLFDALLGSEINCWQFQFPSIFPLPSERCNLKLAFTNRYCFTFVKLSLFKASDSYFSFTTNITNSRIQITFVFCVEYICFATSTSYGYHTDGLICNVFKGHYFLRTSMLHPCVFLSFSRMYEFFLGACHYQLCNFTF